MNNSVNGSLLYSCDDGFEATSGNLSRECTLNGTWNGEPPVCAGICLLTVNQLLFACEVCKVRGGFFSRC